MCTKSLVQFIGSVIGLVVKIDRNIDNSSRGKFSRLAVYIDLGKSLVSKVKNDGKTQRVEYEYLPMSQIRGSEMQKQVEEEQFGPWMLVEYKQRRKP
ncbi:hypothetical protein Gotri_021317 [Gossypium trilobum]|uniref:Uncharacterized protein n=1 Tax=Gossypium trilobum TaxID=34281 RepID=A0A7J9DCH4_9ROSI|nr:hypothetical protein [Gossypium trilobum]